MKTRPPAAPRRRSETRSVMRNHATQRIPNPASRTALPAIPQTMLRVRTCRSSRRPYRSFNGRRILERVSLWTIWVGYLQSESDRDGTVRLRDSLTHEGMRRVRAVAQMAADKPRTLRPRVGACRETWAFPVWGRSDGSGSCSCMIIPSKPIMHRNPAIWVPASDMM